MKLKALIALACSAITLQAHALSIDFRGQYKTGSEAYESRFLFGHDFANGIGGSIEYTMNNTSKSGEGIDQVNWKDTEYQIYYKYKLNDTVTLIPSALIDVVRSKGDIYKIGLQANWAFAPSWRFDSRLRYEYKDYESKDLSKHLDHDNTTRMDLWLRKAVNEQIDTYYNFRWDYKLNNYEYVNKSPNYFENNLGVSYKVTPAFKPYAEIGYLGDTANAQQDAEWRIRIGAGYSF
ncbi:hypothetical protein HQ393_02440 [Chitinibacter bivalviorum]|uniref:Oligogalacturonate-specific porin n=1 Tax=Chitinibacter bivalviorum TaxID=2739434 RepID=A0A7H9BG25_9NEIS|nr:oligogalacturonate-specific porin KdgM family protein [Chitinibacter bivalviorum]QLG87196.1 hypothetical protein HQ393_02440 [Chitinibacter bivalviorum]